MLSNDVGCRLSVRLDREWERMSRRPAVVERVRSWELTARRFATLDEFLVIAGHRAAYDAEADAVVAGLVARAARDPLACRLVLQRILPGLLAVARAEQSRDRRQDVFEELVGAAWEAIVAYRLPERSTHVAARLVSDARHRAVSSTRRRRVIAEEVRDVATLDAVAAVLPAAFDELVEVLVEARRRGLTERDVETVRAALRHDTARQVAAACRRTERMIRYRERRAASEIRRLTSAA